MKLLYTGLLSILFLSFYSCGDTSTEVEDNIIEQVGVHVSSVSHAGSPSLLTVSGLIQASNSTDLSTRMMGFVDKIHVQVGQRFVKNQLLISINNTELFARQAQTKAGVSEAQATFDNAKKDFTRFKSLFEDNSATAKELDDMRTHYEVAKARLEAAKQMSKEVDSQFAYADLRAPFDGVVTNRMIEIGDMANPGVPLISIEAVGDFEVLASIPESEISKVKNGAVVKVIVKALNAEISGKVTELSGSSRNTGGQYLAKIKMDKTHENILSGMFVSVQFPVETTSDTNVILIPSSALIHKGELTGIYTLSQSNTAILRWLRIGRTYGDKVEVLSGLSAGEKFIVSYDAKINNGTKLIVKE